MFDDTENTEQTLLPTNASGLEIALERTLIRATELPVTINTLWSAEGCPADFLPWLAWALSVENWDSQWSETTKRAAIQNSILIHQQKGTIAAIRRVLDVLGVTADLTEWFEAGGEPHTFSLDLWLNRQPDLPLTPSLYARLTRAVDQVKPVRSHYVLSVGVAFESAVNAAGVLTGLVEEAADVILDAPMPSNQASIALWLGGQIEQEVNFIVTL